IVGMGAYFITSLFAITGACCRLLGGVGSARLTPNGGTGRRLVIWTFASTARLAIAPTLHGFKPPPGRPRRRSTVSALGQTYTSWRDRKNVSGDDDHAQAQEDAAALAAYLWDYRRLYDEAEKKTCVL